MYKLFILLLIFVSVDCYCRSHKSSSCSQRNRHHRYTNRQYDKVFDGISSNVINDDLKYYEFCNGKRNAQITEYYGVDFYTMKYPLPEYEEKDITVYLKHRVFYLKGQRKNGQIFRDIRILPRMVKARDGQWFKENNNIVVQFPYKTSPKTETTVGCDAVDEELRQLNRLNRIAEDDLRSLDSYNNETDNAEVITFDDSALLVKY